MPAALPWPPVAPALPQIDTSTSMPLLSLQSTDPQLTRISQRDRNGQEQAHSLALGTQKRKYAYGTLFLPFVGFSFTILAIFTTLLFDNQILG